MTTCKLIHRSMIVSLAAAGVGLGCFEMIGGDSSLEDGDAAPSAESSVGSDASDGSDGESNGSGSGSGSDGADEGFCGDGFLQLGEQCDDSNNSDFDSCTNTCNYAVCGDGYLYQGNEDCEDGNDIATDACVNCAAAVCGDMYVRKGVEECDDGNMDNTDGCTSACELATCGDGFTQTGKEECDDGNENSGDGCSKTCTEERLVFVTSTVNTGNLGGLNGANAICNNLATQANLPGSYRAWLSSASLDSPKTPQNQFMQSDVPYVLVTGEKVADHWDDLTNGDLDHPIDRDEYGAPASSSLEASCEGSFGLVWTGSNPNGTRGPNTCNGFTWDDAQSEGTVGVVTSSEGFWSKCGKQRCNVKMPFYCFQQ